MTSNTSSYRRLFTKELVAVLFVCCMAFFAGEILVPILPLYMAHLGWDGRTIGLMFSVMMVGIALSEVFWGWVVDRVDIKIAIFMGTLMYGAIISALNFTHTLPLFVVVIFIYGVCRSPIFIVGRWFMSVYAPPDLKAFAMALLGASIGVVQSLSGFASGYVTQAWGFGTTFWLAAGIALTAGVVILIAGRWLNFQNHRRTQQVTKVKAKTPQTVGFDIKLLTFAIGLIGTLYFVSYGIFATYLPLYASTVARATTSQVGILFGVRGLVQTLAMLPVGRLADRMGKWSLLLVGVSIVALSMGGIMLSGSYALLMASTIFFSFGSALYFTTSSAILAENVPIFWAGTAMGIYGLMEDVGWMIGPAIGGMIWVAWSHPAAFLFAAMAALGGMPLALWGKRWVRRTARPQQELAPLQE